MTRTSAVEIAARLAPNGLPLVREPLRGVLEQIQPASLDPRATAGDPGLYGPDSATWLIIPEPTRIIAGLRAALLQTLSLPIITAVHTQGSFYSDFLGRVRRSNHYAVAQSLGSMDEVFASALRVRKVHSFIKGISPKGLAYDAEDPQDQAWVSMTFTDSVLAVYQSYGPSAIPAGVADRFVAEQAVTAALLDPRVDLDAIASDPHRRAALQAHTLPLPLIEEGVLPTTYAGLRERMRAYEPKLAVDNLSRKVLDSVVNVPFLPRSQRLAVKPLMAATLTSIPPHLREMIAPDRNARTDRALAALVRPAIAGLRLVHGPDACLGIARARLVPHRSMATAT